MQTEDMDISPLDDTSSPVSTDSRSLPGPSGAHSHSHQGHSHSHHQHTNQKGMDGISSRDDVKHLNSVGHSQQGGSGRLIHHNSRSHHDEHRSRYMFVIFLAFKCHFHLW